MATPWIKRIYQTLINTGASSTQAIGIMANMINESGFNPEAYNSKDPNGGSYGLVQQNGSQYAGLVTGNRDRDMAAQIKVVALNGGFRAASGSTPADAAGNFAANYERCQGCQQGGPQNASRRANAAVVAGWVRSGKWPAAAPVASDVGAGISPDVSGSAGAGISGSTAAAAGNDCALSLGGHVNLLFGRGPTLSTCLVRKTEVRAFMGGLLLVAGGLVMLPGLVIITVYGFRASGAARVAVQVAGAVPGYRRVARRAAGGSPAG